MRGFFLLSMLLAATALDRETGLFTWAKEQGRADSCGPQTVACLLDLFWGIQASEEELLSLVGRTGRGESSLADLARMLALKGFDSEAWLVGYVELARLSQEAVPILAHYSRPSGHFVLVLAADAERAIVSDPASGCLVMRRADFEACWSGTILLAWPGSAEGPGLCPGPALAAAIKEKDAECQFAEVVARGVTGWWR